MPSVVVVVVAAVVSSVGTGALSGLGGVSKLSSIFFKSMLSLGVNVDSGLTSEVDTSGSASKLSGKAANGSLPGALGGVVPVGAVLLDNGDALEVAIEVVAGCETAGKGSGSVGLKSGILYKFTLNRRKAHRNAFNSQIRI